MELFEIFLSKKLDPNIHQNATFLKNFSGEHAPKPPYQIASQNKNSWPPLPNPGDAHGACDTCV